MFGVSCALHLPLTTKLRAHLGISYPLALALRPPPARQVLPAADQLGADQHAAGRADRVEEGVPQASQPGRRHHHLVRAERRWVYLGIRFPPAEA